MARNLLKDTKSITKKREFLFYNDSGQEEKVEALSFKRAIKIAQSKFKDKRITAEWFSKKGEHMCQYFMIPVGRKKKLSK